MPRRRGAVAVLVAVSMVILLGVMALVLDAGMLMIERREAQAAADAAALAASQALAKEGGTLATARAAAQAFATANGFPAGARLTLTVNSPPASGPFAGDNTVVEVLLSHSSPRFFSGIWSDDDLGTTMRAVARRAGGGDGGARLLLLDSSRSGALSLTGSGRIISDSGVQVNSSSSTAVISNNSGSIQPKTAGKANTPVTKIVGGYTDQPWSKIQGKIITGAAPVSDPLASLPEPSEAGLTQIVKKHAWQTAWQPDPPYGTGTMSPGVYNGGVDLGGGMTITMQPGVYYMKGGNFTVANGVTLTGNGVFIYVDSGGGKINFQGGGVMNLSPMTTGPYAGITMYQSRYSTRDVDIANGTTTTIAGTIYAPNARVKFAGGASYMQYGDRFIAKSMEISNNAGIGFGGGSTGSSAATVHNLVE